MTKAKHGRKRRLRWTPWAKYVHGFSAFTSVGLVVSHFYNVHARTFAGRLGLGVMWAAIYYVVMVLVLGYFANEVME